MSAPCMSIRWLLARWLLTLRAARPLTALFFAALVVATFGCGQPAEQPDTSSDSSTETGTDMELAPAEGDDAEETSDPATPDATDSSDNAPTADVIPVAATSGPPAFQRVEGPDEPLDSVDDSELLAAADDNANWLMYGRTYDSQRFSPMKQINKDNVSRLAPVWTFQTGVLDGFECTPLVVDGRMYITTPWNYGFALDCKTGSQVWQTHYQKSLPENMALCCDAVNRGFATRGKNLYMATLDAHLVCLDRDTGEEVWDVPITVTGDDGQEEDEIYKLAYSATVAPLVVKDKVIVGISGAEYGIRGFIDAYDAETGERLWRFYTVPSADDESEPAQNALKTWESDKSWMTGGGSAWVTGTYDPELNTLYWGVGNPSPDFNGDVRKGDNLYTCSIVALNPDDGTYKWHFQNSPHDVWDYDGVNTPVLVDIEQDGQPVKALIQAHRNGYFYCLNRENGKFIYGKPFCEVTWTDQTKGVDGLDPVTGRPFVSPDALPTEEGVRVCPGAAGGKEWNPMAYHPGTGLAYVPVINNCATFESHKAFFIKGQAYWGSTLNLVDNEASGALKAIDVKNGETKWTVETRSPMVAGVLATAGGLVFTGDAEGFLTAYDAETGEDVWHFQCGSGHHASPITYAVDGRQYIAVCVGWGGWTAGFAGAGAPWLSEARGGNSLFVFALPEGGE